jgi:hypothetical protein
MTDEFNLEIKYKGQLKELSAQLLLQGYTHKFKVLVVRLEVFFKPDEEGGYRAVRILDRKRSNLRK